MKKEHELIIEKINQFLENHPDQRFGQVLFNLGINEFQKTTDPKYPNYNLRDIYNDSDLEISMRIERKLEWLHLQKKVNDGISTVVGIQKMTVNERLYATDLLIYFDKYKNSNKEYAKYILKALKVDSNSIEIILK